LPARRREISPAATKPGFSREQAQAELQGFADGLASGERRSDFVARVLPLCAVVLLELDVFGFFRRFVVLHLPD
jgi:hypothetical protein